MAQYPNTPDIQTITPFANAKVLYVSTSGDDLTALHGRIDKPWATIAAAVAESGNGDMVWVFPGAYIDETFPELATSLTIRLFGAVDWNLKAMIPAYGGLTIIGDDPTICNITNEDSDGSMYSQIYQLDSSSIIRLENITMTDRKNKYNILIEGNSITHLCITNCHFTAEGTNIANDSVGNPSRCVIKKSVFWSNNSTPIIRCGTPSSLNTLIQDSHFGNNGVRHIDLSDAVSTAGSSLTLNGLTFWDDAAAAYMVVGNGNYPVATIAPLLSNADNPMMAVSPIIMSVSDPIYLGITELPQPLNFFF